MFFERATFPITRTEYINKIVERFSQSDFDCIKITEDADGQSVSASESKFKGVYRQMRRSAQHYENISVHQRNNELYLVKGR